SQHPQREGLRLFNSHLPARPVSRHTREVGYLGDPTAVFLAPDFDFQGHDRSRLAGYEGQSISAPTSMTTPTPSRIRMFITSPSTPNRFWPRFPPRPAMPRPRPTSGTPTPPSNATPSPTVSGDSSSRRPGDDDSSTAAMAMNPRAMTPPTMARQNDAMPSRE